MESEHKKAHSGKTEKIQAAARIFRKAADTVDRIVKITEDNDLAEDKKEEELEAEYMAYALLVIKIQKLINGM